MGDEHTRKYDDWNIKRPLPSSPSSAANIPQASEEIEEGVDYPAEDEIQISTNPFVANPTETTNEVQSSTATAPFIPEGTPEATEENTSASEDIDPETGLPIPDYLKNHMDSGSPAEQE